MTLPEAIAFGAVCFLLSFLFVFVFSLRWVERNRPPKPEMTSPYANVPGEVLRAELALLREKTTFYRLRAEKLKGDDYRHSATHEIEQRNRELEEALQKETEAFEKMRLVYDALGTGEAA